MMHTNVIALIVCAAMTPVAVWAQDSRPQGPAPQSQGIIHEIRGGVLAHDVDLWAAGSVESGVALNAEVAFSPSFDLLTGKIRPAVGVSVAPGSDRTSYVYADARWEFTVSSLFFAVGLGAAVHNGETGRGHAEKPLGSRVLFHVPVEAGVHITPVNRLSIYFEHVSNGYTAEPNPGLDNLGLRISHRF